jgi:hypothetical protein
MLRALLKEAVLASLFWQIDIYSARAVSFENIFENDRVVIWNVGPSTAKRTLLHEPRRPGVLVTLSDGAVRFLNDADTARSENQPGRLIELKEQRSAPSVPPPGIPPAFPRDGATRVINNDRVVVWDLTWSTGMRASLHFHDKDVVAIYLGSGTVRSIPVDGAPTATPRAFGQALFLPRGRTHIEECIDGPRRDIIIELK